MSLCPALQDEIDHRLREGCEHLSVAEMGRRFAALGYRLDRSMDCRSVARYLVTGRTYPCCTTNAREIDTGLGFANFQARRDANYQALQKLRQQIFAVSRGAILEV